jgi:hypothetical protein
MPTLFKGTAIPVDALACDEYSLFAAMKDYLLTVVSN